RQLVVMPSGDAVQRHPVGISVEVSGEVGVGQRADARVGRLTCGRWLRLLPWRAAGAVTAIDKRRKTGCPVFEHAGLYWPPARQRQELLLAGDDVLRLGPVVGGQLPEH